MQTESKNILFNREFQAALVAHLLRSPRLQLLLQEGKVSSRDFDLPVHQAIVWCGSEVMAAGASPQEPVPIDVVAMLLSQQINAGVILRDEVNALQEALVEAYSISLSEDYFVSKVQSFLAHQRVDRAIQSAKKQGSTPEEIAGSIQAAYQSSIISSTRSTSPLSDFVFKEPLQTIPTGISGLDQRMRGGLGRKKLGIVCASTGLGKTALGVNFGVGAARLGFKAAIASLEIPVDEMHCRIYANVAQYPYEMILYGDLTGGRTTDQIRDEVKQRVMENFSHARDNLRVWDMTGPDEPRNIHSLKKRLTQDTEAGFKPDVLIVDWLDIMEMTETQRKTMQIKEMRHKLKRNAEELSEFAISQDIAIWTMTQANTQADGKDKVGMTNSAESYSKSWSCSIFLGMGASPENREKNIFTLTAAKARDTRPFTVKLEAILEQQRFEDFDESSLESRVRIADAADFSSPASRRTAIQEMAPNSILTSAGLSSTP